MTNIFHLFHTVKQPSFQKKMPELCEVRLDREVLDFYLVGRRIETISFLTDLFCKQCKGIEELSKKLPLSITMVLSRAKKLFIYLSDPYTNQPSWIILTHGMSGRITTEQNSNCHIKFTMSHCFLGFDTWFVENARRIGYCVGTSEEKVYKSHVEDMGIPIGLGYKNKPGFESITKDKFIENVLKSGRTIAASLLDQRSITSGIGTWLCSEGLHRAGVHPLTKCKELDQETIHRLYETFQEVITEGYKSGGVSMKDWIRADGVPGQVQNLFQVYGRKKCAGKDVIKCKVGGRSIWCVKN